MRQSFNALVLVFVASISGAQAQSRAPRGVVLPELPAMDEWINSKPLKLGDLQGKVVVVHFWTFGWINCIRNYPWYAGWQKDFADKGMVMIGIHTPESKGEAKIEAVRKKVKENKMTYPIAIDNELNTWKKWKVRYWPTTVIIDKKGYAKYYWEGEMNYDKVKAEPILRKKIEELLEEK